jgi:hypothetical protein
MWISLVFLMVGIIICDIILVSVISDVEREKKKSEASSKTFIFPSRGANIRHTSHSYEIARERRTLILFRTLN